LIIMHMEWNVSKVINRNPSGCRDPISDEDIKNGLYKRYIMWPETNLSTI
jgi:hypothetical protein